MTSALSSSSSVARLRRSAPSAARSVSIKAARAAPRDSASMPSAPVPAKASTTFPPANGRPAAAKSPCDRMLNSASRARSLVGLTASPGGATSGLPRCLPPMTRISGRLARSELVFEHLFRHLLDRAAVEMTELERSVGEADEAGHGIAEMLHDPAHLAVLAFAQAERDPRVRPLLAFELGPDRTVGRAVDRDALGERGEPRRVDDAVHPHLVAAQPAGRRQFKPTCPPAD